jgi:hypothetical protein
MDLEFILQKTELFFTRRIEMKPQIDIAAREQTIDGISIHRLYAFFG